MHFLISDTFTDSLSKLSKDEQKAAKTTAFDLQMNPCGKGLSFHKIDGAKDKRFWSVRVNRDIRLIVHRSDDTLLLCYVDHHDKAYAWAERRKLETHPNTGAAQLVEIRERVQEVSIPLYQADAPVTPASTTKPPLFANIPGDDLLDYGVPAEWLADALAATEDSIFELIEHLPAEAGEALLELATGNKPKTAVTTTTDKSDPFFHPDAQRRFRSLADQEALEQALAYPWEKWIVFLHPDQRQVVEGTYSGPVRISGSAGTGKSIVALHRAVWSAQNDREARVLLTTFSDTLANALREKRNRLIAGSPRLADRIEVHAIPAIAERLAKPILGHTTLAIATDIAIQLDAAMAAVPTPFKRNFLLGEWNDIVDAWQVPDWEAYRNVRRLGRRSRLSESQRAQVWPVMEAIRDGLQQANLTTAAQRYTTLAEHYDNQKVCPFDVVVVDECQDLSVAQLRMLGALCATKSTGLFFAGDLGQRIFQLPFSWKSLGVDIRGRARTLRVNYRTSHQIRSRADRLLDPEVSDLDGNIEDRSGTQSVFSGPEPTVTSHDNEEQEIQAVAQWIRDQVADGIEPREIGIFIRSKAQTTRAEAAAQAAQLPYVVLDHRMATSTQLASIGTMLLAKGLEFRAVVVMACDDEIIPLQNRIDEIGDETDLEEVYCTERHLLYVACTRARDHLLVSGVKPISEFLEDLKTTLP